VWMNWVCPVLEEQAEREKRATAAMTRVMR